MSPNYCHGDYVLIAKFPFSRFKVGDVVIVKHPQLDTIIKRICVENTSNQFLLKGDNLLSSESYAMGWVDADWICGKVIWTLPQI